MKYNSTTLAKLLSFCPDITSAEVVSITPLKHGGNLIIARVSFGDGAALDTAALPIVHYEGKNWVYTPADWKGWLPATADELDRITWVVNDTDQEAVDYDGQPMPGPFSAEQGDHIRVLCQTRDEAYERLRDLGGDDAPANARISDRDRIEENYYKFTIEKWSSETQAVEVRYGTDTYTIGWIEDPADFTIKCCGLTEKARYREDAEAVAEMMKEAAKYANVTCAVEVTGDNGLYSEEKVKGDENKPVEDFITVYARKKIGSAVCDARRKLCRSARWLAAKAAVPRATLERIECGTENYNIDSLTRVCHALGLELLL